MEENRESAAEQQKSSNPSLVIGIIVIIVVIAGVFWVMNNNKNQSVQMTKVQPTQQAQATVTQQPAKTSSNSAVQGAMAQDITVEGGNYYFKPSIIKVKKGDKVKITFKNSGGFHDFVIDELKIKTDVIKSGAEATVEFTADKTGTFPFYCSVGMHRKMGMEGKLIVE